jgi:signal transduction histidine kinase
VNRANDLFLLLLNLSQMRSQGRIMQLFVETLDALFAPLTFRHAGQEPAGGRPGFPVATRSSSYGYIVPAAAEPLADESQTILHNAIQMLAVVLERLDLEQKLQADNLDLEHLATKRLQELEAAVDELRLSRNAYINLVEDLSLENTSRKQAEAEIRELNRTLEQRVRERTAELLAANQELDAFAYTVSHDLRAPLRAMSGFSQALMEDCGATLPGAAREHLDDIVAGSRRMGELIDGLLRLSRSTQRELRRDTVDLSALAIRLLGELAAAAPERRVTWTVAPGLTARGDERMIEVVLANLLDNAWKYTAKTPQATIDVGVLEYGTSENVGTNQDAGREPSSPARVFFVRDNGAGFDLRHAAKLFQPFQRLHRENEFPGLGIGLATAQRIVRRHGGTIQATAAPGQGAIFNFSLAAPTGKNEDPR